MRHAGKRLKQLLFCSSYMLVAGNSASGHALPFPKLSIHHAMIPHAGFAAPLLTKGSLSLLLPKSADRIAILQMNATIAGPGSLATRHVEAVIKTIVANGVKNGETLGKSQVQFSSPGTNGGTVISGQLQGDVYYVSTTGSIPQYDNAREYAGTVGTIVPANFNTNNSFTLGSLSINPSFQSFLNFPGSTPVATVTGTPGSGLGQSYLMTSLLNRSSGAQRALLSDFFRLNGQSFSLGQKLGVSRALASPPPSGFSGGAITGGIFYGTAYKNSGGNPNFVSFTSLNIFGHYSPLYVFAFGNNPLNNPGGASPVTIPTGNSVIYFANGTSETIKSGQILLPMVSSFSNTNYTVLFTMGANPSNNNTLDAVTTNLSSFLLF
jgi:hypothetical protein